MFGGKDDRNDSTDDFFAEINNHDEDDEPQDEGPTFGAKRQSSSTMNLAELNAFAKGKPSRKKNARPMSVNLGGVGGLGSLGKSVINQDVTRLEKKQRDPVEAMIAKYSLPRTEEDLDSDDDL